MSLLAHEWRKLIRLAALWGFLALCLAFNGLLIYERASLREPFNEASETAAELGQRVDGGFLNALEHRSAPKYGLLDAAREMTNIFEDYETQTLSGFYQEVVKASPLAVSWMAWKYDLLRDRVCHLAQTGAAMDLYAGPVTHDAHQFLFGTLFRAVTAEAGVLGMMSMLYLLGCENLHRTEQVVCSARTGRRLFGWKILSGVAAAVALYALLAAASLGAYFALWDYGGVWGASVSSQFNYLTDMMFRRPFLTWADFTVGGYLAAALALGAALTAAFSLLASAVGMLLRNVYLSALTLMALCLGVVTLRSVCAQAGFWTGAFALVFQPVSAWLTAGGWFTELGVSACVPWQECAAVGGGLLTFGVVTALALRRFERKDLVT